jgi:hypothetical protein
MEPSAWRYNWAIPFLGNINTEDLAIQGGGVSNLRVRRAGGLCEMAASLRGREPGNRGKSTAGKRYQAAQ